MSFQEHEKKHIEENVKRKLTDTELQILAAEWSEHCSYKSSKKHLRMLPTTGPNVIVEKGYDSGVLDVGDGYVVTVHIESHNHPSAVEPFGGAATGVGGVIRDILSAGTRPIALFDGLRFGNIETDLHARWLFKNAVSGIADYGNCLGIPTIGGEVEFDECYKNYALVDVAAVGFGKKSKLIKNHANVDDLVLLIGGSTGRDGVGGSQFASDALEEENRSAVQIPDPFIEKLIIEAILECRDENCINAMKDLGGGGLSCAISETAESLGIGIELDVKNVHLRESDLSPDEIMISESQERMLVISDPINLSKIKQICDKFRIQCSVIGKVKEDKMMHVKNGDETLALLPADFVARGPLIDREKSKPEYLSKLPSSPSSENEMPLSDILLKLLSSPNIASKHWVFRQYDHEVGIRTVIKPGFDGSVLRLDNGKFLSVKIDGNPKHCYIDPRQGAIGCFEEACRNVVCTGATPIGMVDHLQFGNPEDPEIFWTFMESIEGITDFAKFLDIPCVGGKVSFYNETSDGPIKPTPLIGVLGIIEKSPLLPTPPSNNDIILLIGETKDELGGSEYYEYIHNFIGGVAPKVDFSESKKNMKSVLSLISKNLVKSVHDCSKGGLAIGISELCIFGKIGCNIDLPSSLSSEKMLFSESHSRYILVVNKNNLDDIKSILSDDNCSFSEIGIFSGDQIVFESASDPILKLRVDKAENNYLNSLGKIIQNG
ncbi:MAG: phosphoribosylformylglycinamidine synthase subunit PurL [Thaumarchaeota archaeon]|nr:phosphoribosylformylglycinamidine synthase subunit PurL [Nitrososphaerota archaeon]MDC0856932.1 phosphoribosylformylglycinamidine synthase subunit PurL [Candidatus Nitrosopelagicus sp.]MBT3743553.1 phosphoribosylformylglycinamidine synthase subunit PurL [Nitrososphaerota archaeon]MBT4057872.1 phosphoribosylformylglycinamidine synthase subunit PurL [Nitrososphaerota archaeon]MBT4509903.1 phosphoribosylformylglycinamidine synthase subunit PurL [Nitrososphaerota archaeon]